MSAQTQLRAEPSARSPLLERIAAEHAAADAPERAGRRRSLEALLEQGLPTSRDENWRYSSLRMLEKARFAPPAMRTRVAPSALPGPIAGYLRYVFVDGRLDPALSAPGAGTAASLVSGAASVVSGAASPAPGAALPARIQSPISATHPDAAFALLNEAFSPEGARLHVRAGAAPACIEIVYVATQPLERGTAYPRLAVDVEPAARLSLIERHLSLEPAASCISAIEVRIGERALTDHYRVQQLGIGSLWIDTLATSLEREAQYRLHALQLGSLAGRSTCGVRLAGQGAQLTLHALAVGQRRQVLDTYALVEHASPDTRTEQSFRGIAAEHARLGFNGKIIVRAGAHGADSNQSLRGLLAGADAEIDVRPQLEIYTDDVRCSHGATAGKLDDNMLFYLLSRGLERERAMQLLKWAFLEDVVARIEVAELRRAVERSLAGQLTDGNALQELL